jgi:hypothetical protein
VKVVAAAAVVAAIALALVSWAIKPNPVIEALTVFGLPLLWLVVERRQAQVSGNERLASQRISLMRGVVACVAVFTMLDSGPELAIYLGLVSNEWLTVVHRAWNVAWGVAILVAGNYIPKLWRLWSDGDGDSRDYRAARFTGWALVWNGALVVAVWLFLTEPVARSGMLVISVSMVVVFVGRVLLSRPSRVRTHGGSGQA